MPRQGLTRRNGLPQACEACRKAKARCDHEIPTCHRCARRKVACIYDPAPMSKSRSLPATGETVAPHGMGLEQGHQSSGHSPQPSSTAQTSQSSVMVTSPQNALFKRPSYGTTKFNAIFSENQEKFGFGPVFSLTTVEGGNGSTTPGPTRPPLSNSLAKKLQLGVDILRRFPTFRTHEALLGFLHNHPDPWISPKIICHCLESIWSQYADQLRGNRTTEGLATVSADLCANSEMAIRLAGDDEWVNWFTGPALRWEMIGILFTVFGMSFYSRQEWDPLFNLPEQQGKNRKTAATQMRECADDCLKICEEMNSNELVVILMKNLGRLESVLVGDENDRLLSRSGSMMSSFMTVGLHRLPNSPKVTPFSEWRGSLAASAYNLDKVEAIFIARPPHLSRVYCTYKMPLDLSDDELFGGPAVFEKAVNSLDASGWNTSGAIYTNTWLRARCYLSPTWEDILEKTLGVDPQFSCADIDNMIQRVDEVEAAYPPQIQYSKIDEWWKQPGKNIEVYLVTRIHLEVLQCRFLLERLKVSRGFASGQKLLEVAQEMMGSVLSFWLNRDRLMDHVSAFDWFVVCYGIPSAGVLCVELLKSSKPAPENSLLQFSRSEVIQSLTMFLGFLDWTRPTDGNYDLCRKLLRVIKCIVDCVLDTPLPPRSKPIVQNDYGSNNVPDIGAEDLLTLEEGDLNWLSTIDWTQGDWLDFNQPPIFQ